MSGVDFRDRIREVLSKNPDWSVREVSLRAGSDSLLHKVLNPESRGGIKSPGIEKIEAIAAALRVSPGWLAFGEEGASISEEVLGEMAHLAAEEIQAGMRIEEIRNAVASALRDQLALHLAVGATQSSAAEPISHGRSARSPAPTKEGEPAVSRSS